MPQLGFEGFMAAVAGTEARPAVPRMRIQGSLEAVLAFSALADAFERLEFDDRAAAVPRAKNPGRKDGRYGEQEIEEDDGRPFPGRCRSPPMPVFHAA